jgi:hypothetical protein
MAGKWSRLAANRNFTARRIMFGYVESELRRKIEALAEHERISPEYRHNVIRLFLTVPEAKEMLRIIERHETRCVPFK